MRYFSLFLLTAFLSTLTYAQSKKIDVHGFTKEFELEKLFTSIEIQGQIWQAYAMASDGKYIYIVNDKETPPIKSFRLNDGKFMGGLGSIGGGPGEFTSINRSGFGVRKGQLVVQGRRYLRIFDIEEKNEKLDFNLSKESKIPGEFGIPNQGFLLNDNTLAASFMFSPKDFKTISLRKSEVSEKSTIGDFGDYPNLYPDFPNTAKHHLYRGNSDYSEDGQYLVKAYFKFPFIRLFNLKEGSFSDIQLKPKNEQISKVIPDPNGKSVGNALDMFSYQGQVKLSNDLIVSDYQEKIFKRVAMTDRGNIESVPQTDRFLLVLSRAGDLIAKLSPPDWFQKFVLTPDNQMIVFHPEMEDKLFIVDLNQFR